MSRYKCKLDSPFRPKKEGEQTYSDQGRAPRRGQRDIRKVTDLHDFNTGVTTSETDSDNATTTSYGYDLLGRNTLVQQADSSKTTTTYEDTNRRVYRHSDLNTPGDQALLNVTNYDQLGRVYLIQQMENAQQSPDDYTAGIKVLSRYYTAPGTAAYRLDSNPYRAATSTGKRQLLRREPALSVRLQRHHDRNRFKRLWSGHRNQHVHRRPPVPIERCQFPAHRGLSAGGVAVTDEAGVTRTSYTDGLGRLLKVYENGPGYTTSYIYDSLDDLTSVTPASGNPRTFTFDSLKRLSTAVNPEVSGTSAYFYDANGNLIQRNQPSSHPGNGGIVATLYTYDHLNRLTGRTYNDYSQGTPTPWVSYSYDQASPYGKGRLYQIEAGSVYNTYSSYDSLGRPTVTQQQTNGTVYTFPSITYKPVGMASITYPSGRVVNSLYDGAGRPSGVTGLVNATSPTLATYASNVSYAAHGAMTQLSIGNDNDLPCEADLFQNLKISCPNGTAQTYRTNVVLRAIISGTGVSSGRDGQLQGETYIAQ